MRNNAVQNREPSPTSSTDNPSLQDLKERNAELERRLRKYKQKHKTTQTTIKPLIRPKGEAGNRKRGFILYEAMQMSKVENGPVVYDRMRDCVRKACVRVGINLGAHYRHQDPEKVGQVFHLVRKSFPYLTTDRFPHNWAISDMVKGYLAGTRKEHHRAAREDEAGHDKLTKNPSTKSGKAKKRVESDVDDATTEDDTNHTINLTPLATKPTKPSTDKIIRSNSGSFSGKSSSSKRTAATDVDIEEAAPKRQRKKQLEVESDVNDPPTTEDDTINLPPTKPTKPSAEKNTRSNSGSFSGKSSSSKRTAATEVDIEEARTNRTLRTSQTRQSTQAKHNGHDESSDEEEESDDMYV